MKRIGAVLFGLAVSAFLSVADNSTVAVRAARMLAVRTGSYAERPVVVVRKNNIEIVGSSVQGSR